MGAEFQHTLPKRAVSNGGDFPTVIAATILFTWVYNNTNGSLLAMLLTHTTFNLSMFVFPVLDTSLGYVHVLVVFAVAAIVVTGIFGSGELRRKL